MSDEQKAIQMPTKNSETKEKKTKKANKKSWLWILGVVILILISATFILPATIFSGNSTSSGVKFGSYDGEDIELTYDSYFYYQLNQVYNYYVQNYGADAASNYIYNIYYTAYQNALINEEFQAMAKKAGIKPTNSQISDAVVNSGFYSDGSSTFSQEQYSKATDQQKAQILAWMQESVPFEEVESDISGVAVSTAEKDFVTKMGSENIRSFEYLAVNYNMFPDDAAAAFIQENADKFRKTSFIMATFETEEEATSMMEAIAAGTSTMTDAVGASIDTTAENGGEVNDCYKFVLDNFASSDPDSINEIYSSEAGTLVGPVHTNAGYAIFSVTTAATEADPADETTLAAAKTYIATYEQDTLKSSLEVIADEVYEAAKTDWDGAAKKYNITPASVGNCAENPGDSQFLTSFNYTDVGYDTNGSTTYGYIYQAVRNDATYSDKLFDSEIGTVLEPVFSKTAYIIVRPMEGTDDNAYMNSLLTNLYVSYAGDDTIQDFSNTIVNSDKVEDDFVSGFLTAVYGK